MSGYTKKKFVAVLSVSISICVLAAMIGSFSIAVDLMVLASYFSIIFLTYSTNPSIILKYLHFWVMATWAILAVFYLENGNLVLRGKSSSHYGSLPIYVLSWMAFFLVILYLETRKAGKKQARVFYEYSTDSLKSGKVSNVVRYSAYLSLTMVVFGFLCIIRRPYFVLGVDRFEYRQTYMSSLSTYIYNWAFPLIPVVLMVRKENKKIPIVYLIILSMFSIWQGEKFIGLLNLIFFTMISISTDFVESFVKKYQKKIVRIAGTGVLLLAVVVIIHELLLGSNSSIMIFNYFKGRFAAQGELWWLVFGGDATNGIHLNEMGDEISIWIHQPTGTMSDQYYGIYKLMKKFMNPSWVNYSLALGIRATESTRASLFYYGKYCGVLLGQVFFGTLVYFVVNRCSIHCKKNDVLLSVIYLYILQNVLSAVYMSEIQLLTSKRSILIYLLAYIFSHYKIRICEKRTKRNPHYCKMGYWK